MKKLLILLIIFTSCKKQEHCETWEFYQECVSKTSRPFCDTAAPRYIKQGTFCESALNGISAGARIMLQDDSTATLYMHFTKKIE
ncbi:MAG: hypothetical protein ACM3VS_15085 [Candidatus Dadabacteria bacterium]